MMTRFIRTNSDDPDFQKLTQALDVELCRIYNTQQADYEEFNRITDLPTVVLAYEDAFRSVVAALKNMMTIPLKSNECMWNRAFGGRELRRRL
jgi:hypothetical protein